MSACSTVRDEDERVLSNAFCPYRPWKLRHFSGPIYAGELAHSRNSEITPEVSFLNSSLHDGAYKIDPPQHTFWVRNGQIETPTERKTFSEAIARKGLQPLVNSLLKDGPSTPTADFRQILQLTYMLTNYA